MASIHRRPRSPFFHAVFNGPDGRLIMRSTMLGDSGKANAVALELERAAKLAKRDELTEAKGRGILAGMLDRAEIGNTVRGQRIEEHYRATLDDIMKRAGFGESLRNISIEEHFRSWLANKETTTKPSTFETYGQVVDCFLEQLDNRKTKPLTALSIQDVQRFIKARAKKKLAPRTLIQSVKIIRAALNAARRTGYIVTNPAEAVELPRAKGVERTTFTPTEVQLLVNAAKGEWKTLIMLGYFTGARLSDCCRMTWSNIDLVAQTLAFMQGKTDRQIILPIHPALLTHLNSLAGIDNAEELIMPGMARLKSGGRHGLSEGFKRIMRKAGVSAQTVDGMGVRNLSQRSFHALRHSFASAMANEGVPEEIRMKLVGHTTKAVHRGYTHHELETLRSAMNRLPSVG